MAHTATITISPEGNMLLPQEFRDVLGSKTVTAEIDKHNNVILYPLRDVAGVFRDHSKDPNIPFKKIREIAWTEAVARHKSKK